MDEGRSSAGTAAQTPDVSGESDDDLIEMMGWESTDPGLARAAWGAFFVRHRKQVFWMCRNYSDPGNVAAEVFRRVKVSAKTFDLGPMRGELDEARKLNILLSWLGKIAFSIAQDEYRDEKRFGTATDPILLQKDPDPKCPNPLEALTGGHAGRVQRVRELIDTLLSDAEREVLRVSMLWYNPGHSRCYLPPAVLAELCARLKTTAVNIRRLRKTAFDRIRAALEAEFGGSPAAT